MIAYGDAFYGVEYHTGKRKPYRAYKEINGRKRYIGWFATEQDAWHALGPIS